MSKVDPTYLLQKHCQGDSECEDFVRKQADHLNGGFGKDYDALTDELIVIQLVGIYHKIKNNKGKI